jgi:hypothetical protein
LDDTKEGLLKSLDETLVRLQKLYDGKMKDLVESALFKAVECL